MFSETEHDACIHSATSFLNSLFREWSYYSIHNNENEVRIDVPICSSCTLEIPLLSYSYLGSHRYQGVFFLRKEFSREKISFEDVVDVLLGSLSASFSTQSQNLLAFKRRVLSSLKFLKETLAHRSKTLHLQTRSSLNFCESEQSLILGHNFHPTPKSREQFSESDCRLYSPEYGASFEIDWLFVKRSRVHAHFANTFQQHQWMNDLARSDSSAFQESLSLLDFGYIAYPMHPWQWRHLSHQPDFQKDLKHRQIVYAGKSSQTWFPTSSLRSLYSSASPYMLKFSLSVKLTNSVRHLLAKEAERGMQLYDVLRSPKGKEFLAAFPNFSIISEPSFLSIKSEDGRLRDETIVVCRENPFRDNRQKNCYVLATLTQAPLLGQPSLICKFVKAVSVSSTYFNTSQIWFQRFLETVVTPLVTAQANFGIILGAHQQNLVLKLKDNLPESAFFRDCQGTGYSELGFDNFADLVPTISRDNGNVVSETMGNHLFTYYLILNSVFSVISALADGSESLEKKLLHQLRNHLQNILSSGVRDESCLKYILSDRWLMYKGNFLCSFLGINENTTTNPLSIYTPIKNPLCDGGLHA